MNELEWLVSQYACSEGRSYLVKAENAQQAWCLCHRADWLIWVLDQLDRPSLYVPAMAACTKAIFAPYPLFDDMVDEIVATFNEGGGWNNQYDHIVSLEIGQERKVVLYSFFKCARGWTTAYSYYLSRLLRVSQHTLCYAIRSVIPEVPSVS